MKILVTGATGLLGSSIVKYLINEGEEVEKCYRENISWKNHKPNIALLKDFDCVIHAAANTNVEACEEDPVTCYRDNTALTGRLSFASRQADCKFIYISSTGIYGQSKSSPYNEYDDVQPTTHHHRAKWIGEKIVNRYNKNALILRTGWLFGGLPNNPKNFVARRIEEALNSDSKQMESNNEQKGVPTFVEDFAKQLYELISNDECGTFNVVNRGVASRFDYVSAIINLAGLDIKIEPTSSKSFNRKANVSDNESAVSLRLRELGYDALPYWKESLDNYINRDIKNWLIQKKKL